MTSWFEYNERRKPVGDVIDFKPGPVTVEHVDASTIVERIEWDDDIKRKFEEAYGRSLGDINAGAKEFEGPGNPEPPRLRDID